MEDPFTKNDGPGQNSGMPAFQGLLPIQRGGKGCAKTCSKTCSKVDIPIGCQPNFVASAQGHYDLKLRHPIMTSYHDTRKGESGHD